MKVFVTGATGFIGSAIVQELLGAGHQVLGLARSEEAAAAVLSAGAEVHRGSLDDLDSLKKGAGITDGVIHTAFIHDFSNIAASGVKDRIAVEAFGDALKGTGKPLVVTSGIAVLPPGRIGTENDAPDRSTVGIHRISSEEATLALAARGVCSSVMRLPPSVHGDGDHGFVPALIGIAKQKGVSAYIGDGQNHWTAVNKLDAANLFRLALEKGLAGSKFHGVAEQGIPTKEIAEVIGKRLGIPTVTIPVTAVAEHFGWLGHFFGIDCIASSVITRAQLGWTPGHPGLIDDLEHGKYF